MHTLVGWLALGLTAGAVLPVSEPSLAYTDDPPSATSQAPAQAITKAAPPTEILFIRAERVITRPGRVLENTSVLVKNGKIVAVGTDLVKPEGAREIQGKVLCAGFIDAWGALGMTTDALVDGSATAATRAVDAYDGFSGDHLRQEALRAGITSTRVQAGGGARIGGLGALVRIVPSSKREDVLVLEECNLWATLGLSGLGQPTFEFDEEGNGTLTGFGGRVPDPFERLDGLDRLVSTLQAGRNYLWSKAEYKHDLEAWQKTITEKEVELEKDFKKAKKDREKAEKEATDKGKKFEEKKYKEDKRPAAPRYDDDNEVLARVVNGEMPLIVHVHRAGEIRALLKATEGLDRLRLVIAGGSESPQCAKDLVERRIPVIVWPAPQGKGAADEYEGNDLSLAARLSREGVTVLLGSGGLDPNATRDLPLLAELAIGNGLAHDKALEALTIGAARALDVSHRLGAVEMGKDADLQVLDGEPLDSTSRVQYVIAGGRVVVTPED